MPRLGPVLSAGPLPSALCPAPCQVDVLAHALADCDGLLAEARSVAHVALATAKDADAEAARSAEGFRSATHAREYAKNVLLRAMELGAMDGALDADLFPVLATSLQFSEEDTLRVAKKRDERLTDGRRGHRWLS